MPEDPVGTRTDSRIPPRKTGIARLVAATGYSLAGLRAAYRSEEAMRMEVWTLCVAIPLAVWLAETRIEMVLLIGSAVLVMLFFTKSGAVDRAVDTRDMAQADQRCRRPVGLLVLSGQHLLCAAQLGACQLEVTLLAGEQPLERELEVVEHVERQLVAGREATQHEADDRPERALGDGHRVRPRPALGLGVRRPDLG